MEGANTMWTVLQCRGLEDWDVYLLGGEGGSWSGGARLKALPSNMCICERTSSMDGCELSVEESEPQWALTPRLLVPVPVDPPPKPNEVIR